MIETASLKDPATFHAWYLSQSQAGHDMVKAAQALAESGSLGVCRAMNVVFWEGQTENPYLKRLLYCGEPFFETYAITTNIANFIADIDEDYPVDSHSPVLKKFLDDSFQDALVMEYQSFLRYVLAMDYMNCGQHELSRQQIDEGLELAEKVGADVIIHRLRSLRESLHVGASLGTPISYAARQMDRLDRNNLLENLREAEFSGDWQKEEYCLEALIELDKRYID